MPEYIEEIFRIFTYKKYADITIELAKQFYEENSDQEYWTKAG